MKYLKCCLVSLAVGMMAVTAVAQTRSNSAANKPVTTGPITMQGCINGGPRGYTFIQTSTGTSFSLQGASGKFDPYRGKLVNITGTEAPPATVDGTKDMPQFSPNDVKQIGDCPLNTVGKTDRPHGAPLTHPSIPQTGSAPQQGNTSGAATPEYASPGAANQTPPTVGNNPNQTGATGAPSPGTGNPPPQPTPPKRD